MLWAFCAYALVGSAVAVINLRKSSTHAHKHAKVAVCFAGGLRDARSCVSSIESSIYGRSQFSDVRATFATYIAPWLFNDHVSVSTYIASWEDFEASCATDDPSELAHVLKKDIYNHFNVKGVWTASHSGLDSSALRRLSPGLFSRNLTHTGTRQDPPPRWFQRPYHQYALWESCLNLIHDEDVIVKVRPDAKFKKSAQFVWKGRDPASGVIVVSFMGQDLKMSDNAVYVLESDDKPGFVDDTLIFGSASAMNRAVRDFKATIEAGVFQVNDAVYNASYGGEVQFVGPVLPQDAPWREMVPERLFFHHMTRMGLDVVVLNPRREVLELDTCSCGKGERGKVSCCH